MDTDITPIFENDDEEPHNLKPPIDQPQSPDSTRRESDPREVPHLPVLKDEDNQPQQYHQPMYASLPPQYQPPPEHPKWDPFSSIGATAWVALGIAFIIGFVIGKLR